MSAEPHLPEPSPGYVSAESKRQFTLVAGVLGAVFFVIQFILPIVVMFAVMLPAVTMQGLKIDDFAHAVPWQGELWYVETAQTASFTKPHPGATKVALHHVRLADLAPAGEPVALGLEAGGPSHGEAAIELLPEGDRLWVIGSEDAGFYSHGQFTRLAGAAKPARASAPFLDRGHPTVLVRGRLSSLARLVVDGGHAEWQQEPIDLEPPSEWESLGRLEVVDTGGVPHLVAEACEDARVHQTASCTLYHRALDAREWIAAGEASSCCRRWGAAAVGGVPVVVVAEEGKQEARHFARLVLTAGGAERTALPDLQGLSTWNGTVRGAGSKLLLLSQTLPGSRKLVELDGATVARTVAVKGSPFPFGGGMMVLMVVPQLVPMVLSLLLAFILSAQMRKHRVETYTVGPVTRRFASLWQRAWAQVVDALVLGLGPLALFYSMFETFSDPERFVEADGFEPLLRIFALMAAAILWSLLVLIAFSVAEGRSGKTPGKLLMRIRVLGTDLAPCGFWRALVRNLLTFVDGFFNFLVGVLLVALTDNWQRLGDLAARTLVVTDDDRPPSGMPSGMPPDPR